MACDSCNDFEWRAEMAYNIHNIPKLVGAGVTVSQHIARMRRHGDNYIAAAMHTVLPPEQRATALKAALKLLESRLQSSSRIPDQFRSQILSQTLSQSPTASQAAHVDPWAATANVIAASIDGELPKGVLMEAVEFSLKNRVLAVLVRCLCVLVTFKNIESQSMGDSDATDLRGIDFTGSITVMDDENDCDSYDDDKPLTEVANSHISKRKKSEKQRGANQKGQEFVDRFVAKIVGKGVLSRSSPSDDIFLVNLARETPVSDSLIPFLVAMLTERISEVAIFELPAFVYQLLLFASRRCNTVSKRRTVYCVVRHFACLEEKRIEREGVSCVEDGADVGIVSTDDVTLSTLRQVEGTTLLHADYAFKQDPGLVSEVLKLARDRADSARSILSPFGIALLLALARVPSLQSSVLATISSAISRFSRERKFRQTSGFAEALSKADSRIPNPSESLLQAAENTIKDGWDQVSEPLIHVCFSLIDRAWGGSSLSLHGYCSKILETLFRAHGALRGEILEQLLSRIVLQEKSTPVALKILRVLVHGNPAAILEQGRRIKSSIEDLPALPSSVSCSLIDCYKPLFQIRRDLQDFLVLVLRKALFYREECTRSIASCGFLRLISPSNLHARETESSSNVEGSAPRTRMMHDAAQPLRRSLTHQATVRAAMYAEIRRLIISSASTKEIASLCHPLRSLLYQHFLHFIDAAHAPYVLVDKCINEKSGGYLTEPLGELILTLTMIERISKDKPFAESYLLQLAKNMSAVVVQDFNISKDNPVEDISDLESGEVDENVSPAVHGSARANRNRARLLGSVIESLINVVLSVKEVHKSSQTFCEVLVPLWSLRESVFDVLRRLGSRGLCDMKSDVVSGRPPQKSGLLAKSTTAGVRRSDSGRKELKGDNSSGSVVIPLETRAGEFAVLRANQPLVELPVLVDTMKTLAQQDEDSTDSGSASWFKDMSDTENVTQLRFFLHFAARAHLEQYSVAIGNEEKRMFSISLEELKTLTISIYSLIRIYMKDFERHRSLPEKAHSKSAASSLNGVNRCLRILYNIDPGNISLLDKATRALLPVDHDALQSKDPSACVVAAIKALQRLVESLLSDNLIRETRAALSVVIEMSKMFFVCRPEHGSAQAFPKDQARWAHDLMVTRDIGDSDVAQQLSRVSMGASHDNRDMNTALKFAKRVLDVLGHCDADNDETSEKNAESSNPPSQCEAINPANSFAVIDAILDAVTAALSDSEWGLGRVWSLRDSSLLQDGPTNQLTSLVHSPTGSRKGNSQAGQLGGLEIVAEDVSHTRLNLAVKVLDQLVRSAIGKWRTQERIVKVVTYCYRVLSLAVKTFSASKADPRHPFMALIDSAKLLGPNLWVFLAFIGSDKCDRANAQSRASKEARIMPLLIYEAEKFEKLLIASQRHTKTSLLKGMKRNTARDFRISLELLTEGENDENVPEDENLPLQTRNLLKNKNSPSTSEPRKKRRLSR